MNFKIITFTIVAFLLCTSYIFSQGIENTVFQLSEPASVGARAMGMGGAFIAVADDYSAIYWNPAGLAQIRYNQFFGSLSHMVTKEKATYNTYTTSGEASFTRLNSIGLVFPIPTYQGSLVFAGGYNRVQSLDAHLEFFWTNPLPDGAITQDWVLHKSGGLNNWTFGGAMAFSPKLVAGATLIFWDGTDDYELSYIENDLNDNYLFNSYTTNDNIITQYTAFNIKFGGLYKVGKHLRIGATIATPTTFTAKEDWYYDTTESFDDDSLAEGYDSGLFEYKIASPFEFGAGAAISVGNITISGDVEYQDWSQIKYKTEPPTPELNKSEANREIQRTLQATTRLRVGGELTIPGLGGQIRGGYMLDPTPYKNAQSEYNRQYVSLGVSFLLDSQVKLDISWRRGWWKYTTEGLTDGFETYLIDEDIQRDKILSTIIIKF